MQFIIWLIAGLFPLLGGCKNEKPAGAVIELPDKSGHVYWEKDTLPPGAPADTVSGAISPETEETEESPSVEDAKSLPPAPTSGAPARPSGSTAADEKNGFSDLKALDPTLRLDIRYATANNFTGRKIYDCPRCLLRPAAARALVKAHAALQKRGLGLKLYDCYRPRPYQQRLWDAVPDPDYVTPPAKGSMHSRGAAVDLTIVDANGRELDMGTPYDFFGRKAHYDFQDLPAQVLTNRRLLRETMEAAGFGGIRTEWWHFSYRSGSFPLSSYVWECGL
jgi:D-alanyl-D-alanine dipeptidase